ncbi:hypothetical protein H0H81_002080 [Sphagnurus paluster]|uniref:Uncharacterized protein n=1 Tax=Sphagnurus paluster TaxID=117069 RepID=A0A9P7FT89_9AGAR|nr:hypothetical protein H0H81_002080 [Sphagnurus paluster]
MEPRTFVLSSSTLDWHFALLIQCQSPVQPKPFAHQRRFFGTGQTKCAGTLSHVPKEIFGLWAAA